jgi:hypothetical protein
MSIQTAKRWTIHRLSTCARRVAGGRSATGLRPAWLAALAAALAAFSIAGRSRAEGESTRADPIALPAVAPQGEGEGACAYAATERGTRGIGLETNVLWPFFPGGIFELRLMVPVLETDRRDWRGEVVIGAYSDFASRIIRGDESGKVVNLSAKLGYRQFFVYGLHVEVTANVGWRHESDRPPAGTQSFPANIDGFQTRLWTLAGYQHEFSSAFYANARVGMSVNVYRSDAYASLEKVAVPGGDLNLGVRF